MNLTITMDLMRKALVNTFDGRMSEDDASSLAEFVMNFFGFNDRILDNHLESSDRNIFYMLEDEGLLHATQEEIFIKVGQRWRLNYWVLKKSAIVERATDAVVPDDKFTFQTFYEDVWRTMAANEDAPMGAHGIGH